MKLFNSPWILVASKFPFFDILIKRALYEKSPNTEFFLVCIFPNLEWIRRFKSKYPYSVQIRENTDQKKLRTWIFFTQWRQQWDIDKFLLQPYWHAAKPSIFHKSSKILLKNIAFVMARPVYTMLETNSTKKKHLKELKENFKTKDHPEKNYWNCAIQKALKTPQAALNRKQLKIKTI